MSKIYTNNSSKELIKNIKQLVDNLYNNEQITKQVYNNLIKAITYKKKEQNKTLNDKIEANNAQYNLDRMNAEISAYSSGDLLKYYKPNAFEQAKFEYSPLGKVFIDGLDKSDRKEGLLKRLKNIEDKSNNQLLALRHINRPAIRGRNDDDNDDYKTFQNFKKELIDKGILHKDGSKKFDNIVNKCKQAKDKNIAYISPKDVSTRKVDIRKFDIYDIFKYYIEIQINYDEINQVINNIKTAIEIYEKKNK